MRIRVRATQLCFVQARRRPGDVFEVELKEGAKLPPFLEEVSREVPATSPEILPPSVPGSAPRAGALPENSAVSVPEEPETFSQVAEKAKQESPTLGGVPAEDLSFLK